MLEGRPLTGSLKAGKRGAFGLLEEGQLRSKLEDEAT